MSTISRTCKFAGSRYAQRRAYVANFLLLNRIYLLISISWIGDPSRNYSVANASHVANYDRRRYRVLEEGGGRIICARGCLVGNCQPIF
jgi:hypothetical protein